MASLKADKPAACCQPAAAAAGQAKKEPVKAPVSTQAPKKAEQKPQEPKKRVPGGMTGGIKPAPAPGAVMKK